MQETDSKIRQLKKYFSDQQEVSFAFLFGSHAAGSARTASDWDVAIYITTQHNRLEWEVENTFPDEERIWRDITDILQTDNVDLLILNRAPASIAEAALSGMPLDVKNEALRRRFLRIISSEAEDYRRFVDDFYAISERSQSLTDRDREDLKRTIDFVEEQMGLYPVYREFTQREYESEPRKRNEMERWLENIINAVIDISKVYLASNHRLIPPTYRENVARAAREFGLEDGIVEVFEKWVRLRNTLAHEYLDLKWKGLTDFAQTSEPLIRQFVDAAKKFVES